MSKGLVGNGIAAYMKSPEEEKICCFCFSTERKLCLSRSTLRWNESESGLGIPRSRLELKED
jgi:hypothetical protein